MILRCLLFLLTVSLTMAAERSTPFPKLRGSYDVVIAGAGTGGFGTAMQAARMGASVLLVEETDWIGGQMNAAAVTSMDEGPIRVRERGLYHEFVEAALAHYRKRGISAETAYWNRHICVEPRVGQDILYAMLDGARGKTQALDVSLVTQVTKVLREGSLITGVVISNGKEERTVPCRVLVDATEWGDVLPLTGARYRVGNCLNDNIMPGRAIQDLTWTAVIKQYPKGVPAALKIEQPPPGYTDNVHKAFVKTLIDGDAINAQNRPWTFSTFIGYRGMPNSEQPDKLGVITRTHMNYNNDFHTSIADVEDLVSRQKTLRAAALKTLHLLYYVQHTLGKSGWSVADDEGFDSAFNRAQMDAWIKAQPDLEPYRAILQHFSIMAYARESRRIVGLHTLTAHEIERKPGKPVMFENTVALGDYAVDLHGSKKPELLELDLDPLETIPQGEFGSHGTGPFAIPFECFIPEKIDGLLAAEKNISQSRLANGATRLQPSTMLMGQAAGAIAALAVKHGVQPRAVDPVLVQTTLLEAGDTLQITPLKDIGKSSWEWKPVQLVTVRGLMALEEGRFHPVRPFSAQDFSLLMKGLAGKEPGGAADPGAATLAAHLVPLMAEARVRITGTESLSNEKPLTRLQVANVVAQCLESRALARATGKEQTLPWPASREPTPLKPEDIDPQLAADIRLLIDHKVVSSMDYWIAHATENETCDGKNVAVMLRNTAKKLRPEGDKSQFLAVCVEEGILGTAGYWQKSAVEGGKCSGTNVATVIRRIAQRLEHVKK